LGTYWIGVLLAISIIPQYGFISWFIAGPNEEGLTTPAESEYRTLKETLKKTKQNRRIFYYD